MTDTYINRTGKINLSFSSDEDGTSRTNRPKARVTLDRYGTTNWFGSDTITCAGRFNGLDRIDDVYPTGALQTLESSDDTIKAQFYSTSSAPVRLTINPHGLIGLVPGVSGSVRFSVYGELGGYYYGFELINYSESLGMHGDREWWHCWLQRRIYFNSISGLPSLYLYWEQLFPEDRISEHYDTEGDVIGLDTNVYYDLENLGEIHWNINYSIDRILTSGGYQTRSFDMDILAGLEDHFEPDLSGLYLPTLLVKKYAGYKISPVYASFTSGSKYVTSRFEIDPVWMWALSTATGYSIE